MAAQGRDPASAVLRAGLHLPPIVAEVEALVAALPRDSGRKARDVRRYALDDSYDPGPSPAMVGGTVGFVTSRNYQSVRLDVRCEIPSRPDMADMAARTARAFEFMFAVLDAHAPVISKLQQALGMGSEPVPVVAAGPELAAATATMVGALMGEDLR